MENNELVMEARALVFVENDKSGEPLTDREREVLKCVIMGKSNTEIAQELMISSHTAKAHVCSILRKLSVDDRVQAAVKAVRERLIDF